MALVVKNTKDLVDPKTFKVKMLVYGLPGLGKTMFAGTAPNPGVAACETGHGKGLLTLAGQGVDYVEPSSMAELEALCKGAIFKDKDTLVLDSLTAMVRSFVKDYALTLPRSKGNSPKRDVGVPELDDYGVMGEVVRRLLMQLLLQDKHVIVTATERVDKPDPESGFGEFMVGPDLPGQMFLGSTAMFDFVLRLRTRPKLKNPNDAKSRYTERYFLSQPDGAGSITKCRSNKVGIPLLDKEEIFDLPTGQGSFPFLMAKILKGYEK